MSGISKAKLQKIETCEIWEPWVPFRKYAPMILYLHDFGDKNGYILDGEMDVHKYSRPIKGHWGLDPKHISCMFLERRGLAAPIWSHLR